MTYIITALIAFFILAIVYLLDRIATLENRVDNLTLEIFRLQDNLEAPKQSESIGKTKWESLAKAFSARGKIEEGSKGERS